MLHDLSGWRAGGRHHGRRVAWSAGKSCSSKKSDSYQSKKAWTARAAHTAIPSTLPQRWQPPAPAQRSHAGKSNGSGTASARSRYCYFSMARGGRIRTVPAGACARCGLAGKVFRVRSHPLLVKPTKPQAIAAQIIRRPARRWRSWRPTPYPPPRCATRPAPAWSPRSAAAPFPWRSCCGK